MATTEELILKVSADVGPLKKDMEDVKKSVADVGDETEKTSTKSQSSLSKLIPSWKEVGVAITGALVGMGAAGLEVISVAADAPDATTAKFNTVFLTGIPLLELNSGPTNTVQQQVDQERMSWRGRHLFKIHWSQWDIPGKKQPKCQSSLFKLVWTWDHSTMRPILM